MALGDAETTDFWTEFLRGLLLCGHFKSLYGDPLKFDFSSWRPIAALLNAMIAQDTKQPTARSPHLRRANEHLLADLVEEHIRKS